MSENKMDISRAKALVEQISQNLAALPHDNPNYARLRAEVEDLKAMLDQSDAHPPEIAERMKSVHGSFDRMREELRADGIRAGIFLSEIGRMLGLE